LLLDYFKKKTIIRFVPITWKEEDQVSNARNFSVGKNALIKLFKWRLNKEVFTNHHKSYYNSKRIQ